MGVKVANGKGLHVGEHLVPDVLLGSLAHPDHQEVIQERRNNTHQVDSGQHEQKAHQRAKVRIRLPQHGQDVIVHQQAQRGGTGCLSDGVEHNANYHDNQGFLIRTQVG